MIKARINSKLERVMTVSKPIKVIVGGRGSGKSIAVGDIMALKMEAEGADIYCLREFQESVFDSVHRVIGSSVTERLKLKDWTIFENRIVSSRGARTRYAGASRNPSSLQSASNYKYSWFEEAQKASKESLDLLLPTIIRSKGAECWFTGNPMSSADPFSQRFINPYLGELESKGYYEDDLHLIIVVNWRDNPWWNQEQELLRLWDYENRPRAEYNWIWEGKFNDTVDNAIILPEWVDAAVDAHKKLDGIERGSSVMGFDPADGGMDDKAHVCRRGGVIYRAESWGEGDVDDAINKAFGIAYDENIAEVVFDEVGIGAAVKVGLKDRISNRPIKVTGFKGSESVDNPDSEYMTGILNENYFKNKRAQYSWLLRDRFERTYRAIVKNEYIDPSTLISLDSSMPALERLKSELVRVPRKWVSGSDMIQIMSKPEMRKNKIKSPNLFDALKMSFATAKTHAINRNSVQHAPIINKRVSAFRR
jgi:phage terminase large subunit